MKKNIAAAVIIIIIFVLSFKNYFFKELFSKFLAKNLNAQCEIKSAKLGFNGCSVHELRCFNGAIAVSIKDSDARFTVLRWQPLVFSAEVSFNDANIILHDLQKIKKQFSPFNTQTGSQRPVPSIERCRLNLSNVIIKSDDTAIGSVDVQLSFKGTVKDNRLNCVEHIEVKDASVTQNDFQIHHLQIHRFGDNVYKMTIPKLSVKNKVFNEGTLFFEPQAEGVMIRDIKSKYFGDDASAQGNITFKENNQIHAKFEFNDIPLQPLLEIISDKEKVIARGSFNGDIEVRMAGTEVEAVNGQLRNDRGGIVNVKDQSALAYLEKDMDKGQYALLVKSLQNYTYDQGNIQIRSIDNMISMKIRFDSQTGGQRNIEVNEHK